MITLTIRQLLEAARIGTDGRSAIGDFLSLRKPVAVSWENRDLQSSLKRELASYQEALARIVSETADGSQEREDAVSALLDQKLDSPGERVRISDLHGDLSEESISRLLPFLTDNA